MQTAFKTDHGLDFEVAAYPINLDPDHDWQLFRIGTCEGLWCSTDTSYCILAIDNKQPGNGHLNDVFQWFESSCKRDGKSLKIMEVWNEGFKRHLLEKRGFTCIDGDNVEKSFKK